MLMQVCKIVKSFVSVLLEDFEELIKVVFVIFFYDSTVRLGEANRLGQMNPLTLKVGSKLYKLPILF